MRLSSLALLVFVVGSSSLASPLIARQTAAPNAATLEQRLVRLCDDVDQRRELLHISGLSLAVVKDDRVILARGFGLRDREKKIACDERTLYGIGSTTKAFTSMLCAMLVDEGKLAFTDRPATFLPWFKFKDPTADANATLRDLLCHRTGLTRNDIAWVGTQANRDDLLHSVAEIEPNAPFYGRGKQPNGNDVGAWQYNNCMFLCAGECAAAVAGRSWDELVATRLFAPLGMKQSVTTAAGALADASLSKGYDWDAKTNDFKLVPFLNVDNMAPAGSICSTVVDMAQWARFLLNRGTYEGKRLVADAEFDQLWKDDDDFSPNYGLGWFIHPSDAESRETHEKLGDKGPSLDGQSWKDADGVRHRVIEHGGNVPGFAAEVGLLPEFHLGLVMLSNVSASQLQADILPLVFNDLLGTWKGRRTVSDGKPLAEEATKEWLGVYVDQRRVGLRPRSLTRVGDHLVLVLPQEPGQPAPAVFTLLWPGDDGRYWFREDPDSYATIVTDDKGHVTLITMERNDVTSKLTPLVTNARALPVDRTIDELVQKRSEADGLAKVTGWKSLRLTGKLRFPQAGVTGSVVATAATSDRLRVDYDAGKFGHAHLVVDGRRGRREATLAGAKELDASEAATALFASPFFELCNWQDVAEEVDVDRIANAFTIGLPLPEMCYAVRVKPEGADPLTYYVATKSSRVVAVEGATAFLGIPNTLPMALLGDFRDVQGVKIPFLRQEGLPEIGNVILQFEKAEVDVDLPADFFNVPVATAEKTSGS